MEPPLFRGFPMTTRRRWILPFAMLATLTLGHDTCQRHSHGNDNGYNAVLQLGKDVEDVELSDSTERINLRYFEEAGYTYAGRTCAVWGVFAYDPAMYELVDCRETVNAGYEENVDFLCTVVAPGRLEIQVWKTDGGAFRPEDHELMKTEFAILTTEPGDHLAPGISGNGRRYTTNGCGILTNAVGFETSIWRAQ